MNQQPDAYQEDIEDLRAHVMRLTKKIDDIHAELEEINDSPANQAKGGSQAQLFIVAFEPDDYDAELKALAIWVTEVLVPIYVDGKEISSIAPWCQQWPLHDEAVARLHALWLAWQDLTTPDAGLTGPSTWHREHLDATLAALRHPNGPFAACQTDPENPRHQLIRNF